MFPTSNLLHGKIIFECRSLLNRLGAWELHQVYREKNWIANLTAKEGSSKTHFDVVFVFVVPPVFA